MLCSLSSIAIKVGMAVALFRLCLEARCCQSHRILRHMSPELARIAVALVRQLSGVDLPRRNPDAQANY